MNFDYEVQSKLSFFIVTYTSQSIANKRFTLSDGTSIAERERRSNTNAALGTLADDTDAIVALNLRKNIILNEIKIFLNIILPIRKLTKLKTTCHIQALSRSFEQ